MPRKTTRSKVHASKAVGSGDDLEQQPKRPTRRRAIAPEPIEDVKVLERLELDDLVFDDGKVKARLNLFPVTLDGEKEIRLYIVKVPGEEDTDAAVWFRNTQYGVEQVHPVMRVISRTNESFSLEDGTSHTFKRGGGCGCGNKLKHWKAWNGGHIRIIQAARQ